MTQNRVRYSHWLAVVHKSGAGAQSPQRRSSYFIAWRLASVLNDSVTSADVVQQKIAERVNDFVSERGRYFEFPAVDRRAGVHCRYRRNVTDGATRNLKQLRADKSIGSVREFQIAWWCFGRAHEIGKQFDVVSVVFGIRNGVVISDRVSVGSIFLWL